MAPGIGIPSFVLVSRQRCPLASDRGEPIRHEELAGRRVVRGVGPGVNVPFAVQHYDVSHTTPMPSRSRLLLLVVCFLVAALCIRLGFWQLSRLEERRNENRRLAAARVGAVVSLNAPLPAGSSRADRRIVVRGEYDRTHEVVLRGHVYRELPGVQVVTPLKIEGSDSAVLVNRGFLPSPDATFADTDSLNEPGVVEVKGVALAIPVSADSGAPWVSNGKETWRRLDLAALRARIPYPLIGVYVLQSPDSGQPRYPRRLEPQPLNDGPHLSYAVQWFAFAAIAIGGGTIFAFRKGT